MLQEITFALFTYKNHSISTGIGPTSGETYADGNALAAPLPLSLMLRISLKMLIIQLIQLMLSGMMTSLIYVG